LRFDEELAKELMRAEIMDIIRAGLTIFSKSI
jgi:hypothetical protein